MNIQIGQLWQRKNNNNYTDGLEVVLEITGIEDAVPRRYLCRRLNDGYEAYLPHNSLQKYWSFLSGPQP
jgi:hypothetical protein